MPMTVLGIWPAFIFGVLEPVALVWAYITFMSEPLRCFSGQALVPIEAANFSPQALIMTLQTGNVYLLLAALAIICCWTKHKEIALWYLVAVAFADYGHIYACWKGLGDSFWNYREWNDLIWGNVGASIFLNINRWLTVMGLFGKLEAVDLVRKTK